MANKYQLVFNHHKQVKRDLRTKGQKRLTLATREVRDVVAQALDAGTLPIQSDTHALAKSLSVQTPQGSDSDRRTEQAKQAYVQGGRWRDPVNEALGVDSYTPEHFDARVAPEEPLPHLDGHARSALLTRLAWGYWWWAGHRNEFTGKYEHRVWLDQLAISWSTQIMPLYFKDLLK